ncbi:hypothetical protein [Mycobacterium sp. 3519A]|jgi:hypothetical protein|uniref:hypothetical protein n=1 Tax=Mycobacterium sp. 3519A TaxID=2057184 RepID=UPI000C7A7306|nr:hypothetical protein [Mycobacterium sp. 3519A]
MVGIHFLREASSCDLWMQFDFSQAASNYSGLAGVLAGFAFLAIMLVLNRQHRRDGAIDAAIEHRQDNRFLTALGSACVGLITAATLFSLLSGEEGCALISGRALSKEVLAGVAFHFSVYTLLFGAVQLISAATLGVHFRFIVAVLAPPVVVSFIVASLDELALSLANPPQQPVGPHESLAPGWTDASASLWNFAHNVMTWLIPTVFALCLAMWLIGFRWRRATEPPQGLSATVTRVVSTALTYLPYTSLALVAYAVWRTAMLGRLSVGAHIGANQAKVLVLVCTLVVVLQSASLSFSRGDDRPPEFESDGVSR